MKTDTPRRSDVAYERETSILLNDAEAVATVYTAQPTMIRRLERNPLTTRTEVHRDDRGRVTGVEFKIPKWAVTFRSQRRQVSEAQRRALLHARTVQGQKPLRVQADSGQPGHPVAVVGGWQKPS